MLGGGVVLMKSKELEVTGGDGLRAMTNEDKNDWFELHR